MAMGNELEEGRHRKFGRAHKNQAKRHMIDFCAAKKPLYLAASFATLVNFFITRSRFSFER
jgi:hypothetical protein